MSGFIQPIKSFCTNHPDAIRISAASIALAITLIVVIGSILASINLHGVDIGFSGLLANPKFVYSILVGSIIALGITLCLFDAAIQHYYNKA